MVSVNRMQRTHMTSVMHMCSLHADFVGRIMKCYLGFAVYDEFFAEMVLLDTFTMFRGGYKQGLYLRAVDRGYSQIQKDLTKVEERYMVENDFVRQLKETISQQERRICVMEEENQRLQKSMEEERRRQKDEECFRQVFENNLTVEQMRHGVI